MKVIFLNCDGVLNNSNTKAKCGKFVGIDSANVRQLKKIVDETGAIIVLETSWRTRKDVDVDYMKYLRNKLGKFELRILSTTPVIENSSTSEEINEWLKRNDDVDIESYVVIEDELFDSNKEILKHTVFTDPKLGITEEDADKAINILNGGTNDNE